MGTSARARRKNDDIPRDLHNLTFSESFHWLIAKTQTQDPIISPQVWETAISGKSAKTKRGEHATECGFRSSRPITSKTAFILKTGIRDIILLDL